MRPETPDLLHRIVTQADALDRAGRPGGAEIAALKSLLYEAQFARSLPCEAPVLIDDATEWLLGCLINAEQTGPLGPHGKWLALLRCLLPFVRQDLAFALDLARAPTTDQDAFARRSAR